ncbi:hypothetical protein RintRC_5054 [Richelia intracellularis]|nr:hypothetical protein RintRC_5054 [Richelia intracellularis]
MGKTLVTSNYKRLQRFFREFRIDMDTTGARWTMRGAEAVLPLGSLYISGDWDEYWQFHLQQEHKSNHLALYSSGIPLSKQVFKARCSTTPPPLPILV